MPGTEGLISANTETNNDKTQVNNEKIGLSSPQKQVDTGTSTLKSNSVGGEVDVCNALLGLSAVAAQQDEEEEDYSSRKPLPRVSFAASEDLQRKAQDYRKLYERVSNNNQPPPGYPLLNKPTASQQPAPSFAQQQPAPSFAQQQPAPSFAQQQPAPPPPQPVQTNFTAPPPMMMPPPPPYDEFASEMMSGSSSQQAGAPMMPFTPASMCMFAISMAQYWSAMAVMAKQHLQQHEAQMAAAHQQVPQRGGQLSNKRSRFDNIPVATDGRTLTGNMQMPANVNTANLQSYEGSRLFHSTTDGANSNDNFLLPQPVTKEITSNKKQRRSNEYEEALSHVTRGSTNSLQAQRFGSIHSLSTEAKRINEANTRQSMMMMGNDDDHMDMSNQSRHNLLPQQQSHEQIMQQYQYQYQQQLSQLQSQGYNAFDESDNEPPIEDNSEDDNRKSSSRSKSTPRARGSNGNNLVGMKVSFYAWDGILIDQVKDRSNDIRITRVASLEEWLACFEDCNAVTQQEYHVLEGLIHDPNIDRIVESLRQAARHHNRKNDALYKKAFGWDYLKDQMKIGRTQMITTIYWTTYVIYLYHHPAMQSLKMDRETFLNERIDRNNPHFQNIDNLEIERLLQYRNALICAFQIIPPHRNEVMMLKIGACVERSGRKYQISSSGQMLSTTRRRTLYRMEAAAFESNANSGETPITAYITNPNSGRDMDDVNANNGVTTATAAVYGKEEEEDA